MLNKLGTAKLAHAVSGSFAVARMAPVAPPRLLLLYVDDVATARAVLDVRPTDLGANVMLVVPKDTRMLEEAKPDEKGVCWAPLLQVAADLLTSANRGPAEAEALVTGPAVQTVEVAS